MNEQNGVLSAAQKAMLALDLAAAQGWRYEQAAEALGASIRAVESVRGILKRRPDLEQPLRDGTISLNAAELQAGYKMKVAARAQNPASGVFGKGDKWWAAAEIMRNYLRGWKKRDFAFAHLNPAEAQRRLRTLDEIVELLQAARVDLEARSHKARLSVPNK